MKLEQKAIGLCYHSHATDEFDLIREAGFDWLRMGVTFPWKEKMFGELSPHYLESRHQIELASKNGFRIMANTPGLGSYRYDAELEKTRWFDEWPDFIGVKGSSEYYENVRGTCAWYAKDLAGMVGPLWCHMNEIDIETFHGDYSTEIAAETAFHSAAGIVSTDPDALCGINLSRYWEGGLEVADMAYRPGHSFGYIGDDQYFGSWQGNTVEMWSEVIDRLHERYGLPVVANEWGYSSGGEYRDKPPEDTVIPAGLNTVCHVFGWHHEVEGGHTEAVQAAYVRRGLEIFARHPHILGSFLFAWKDAKHCYHCGKELCPSECFWGVVHDDLSQKPVFHAIQQAVADYYPKAVLPDLLVTADQSRKPDSSPMDAGADADSGADADEGANTEAVRMAPIFAKGADVGWLPQMEAAGFRFFNDEGVEQDCLEILRDHGMDAIRLRAWVNPSDNPRSGHCSTAETVAMAQRAAAMGFRIMIDLHYSDSWADPGQQNKPAEWVNHTFEQLLTDVYEYTLDVMRALRNGGITPEWVQVGNEISNGLLWPTGHIDHYDQMARLVRSGCHAVCAGSPESRIILHLDSGNDEARFTRFFGPLEAYRIPYDVIGVSYYPYWLKADYLESISDLTRNLADLANRYEKEVMVVEVGGEPTKPENTHALLKAAFEAVRTVPGGMGTGIFYWEPEGAHVWSHYDVSCWQDDGRPSPALDAFLP